MSSSEEQNGHCLEADFFILYNIDVLLTVISSFIEMKINKPLQEKKALRKHQIQEVVP